MSWGWSWTLPPLQCHEPLSIVLQALCLSDIVPWIYLSLTLYNHKGFELGPYLNGLVFFLTFFNLSLNLAIRSSWSEPQSAPSLDFADCIYFGYLMRRADSLEKTLMLGKIEDRRRRGTTEDEMVGWHHWLHGHEFEQAPGVGDRQGGLACCSPWGHKESDMTEQLNWTEMYFN